MTLRQRIVALLQEQPATVRDLADLLEIGMAEVVQHLQHIQRSLGRRLIVGEATCESCGLTMSRHRRFTAPSRCPRCRSERTSEPLLRVAPPS